jgi:CheY-like chemotaxis protein
LPADDVLTQSKAIDAKALAKVRAKKKGNATLELAGPEGAKVSLERQPIVVEGETSGGVWSPKSDTSAESAVKGAAEVALIERIGEELSIAMDGITAISMRAQQMDFHPDVVEHFQKIRRSTEQAMAAIGDLVDFSNLSGNIVLRKEPFVLRPALAGLVGRLLLEAEDHHCRLRLKIEQDVSDNLVGDAERLDMILKNLLESAFAMLPGAEVTLQITPEYVTDSGIQVSFAIVYSDEGESKPTSMAGAETGMRVSVARFMVNAMGGKLAIAAHPTVGDALYAFTIEFQVRPDTPAARPSYVTMVGMPVLVVASDAQQRHTLAELLRGWRMLPLEADNAPVALALLDRFQREGNPVPLVILTNRLGHQDGFLLAFRIRQNPKLASSLVMMLATEGRPGDAMACRENGIAAYMRYPVNDEQLNQAIKAVTGAVGDIDAAVTTTLITRHSLREHRKGATILLVDASRDSQLLAAHFLGREDCSVVVASDAKEALSALDQDVYDVVLVDTSLEGFQGDDAAQLLRARIRNPEKTRLVAITDKHTKAFDKAKLAIGFNGTLAKPFRKDDLHSQVETVVRSRSKPRASAPSKGLPRLPRSRLPRTRASPTRENRSSNRPCRARSRRRPRSGTMRTSAGRWASRRRRRTASRLASRSIAKLLAHHAARGRELVVAAEPAVHVDRAHLRGEALGFHDPTICMHRGARERRHVLAEIDGEVGFAVRLVRGDRAPGTLAQDALADRFQLRFAQAPLLVAQDVSLEELARRLS